MPSEMPKVYEGYDDYVFVCYAHADRDVVLPIIAALVGEGYNVWYDDGIEIAEDYPEYIAEHIRRCKSFVTFVSPSFLDSNWCKDEVNYALDLKIERILPIYLKKVELTPGLQMRMGRKQAIRWYEFYSDEEFLAKLFKARKLDPCLTEEGRRRRGVKPRGGGSKAAKKQSLTTQTVEPGSDEPQTVESRDKSEAIGTEAVETRITVPQTEAYLDDIHKVDGFRVDVPESDKRGDVVPAVRSDERQVAVPESAELRPDERRVNGAESAELRPDDSGGVGPQFAAPKASAATSPIPVGAEATPKLQQTHAGGSKLVSTIRTTRPVSKEAPPVEHRDKSEDIMTRSGESRASETQVDEHRVVGPKARELRSSDARDIRPRDAAPKASVAAPPTPSAIERASASSQVRDGGSTNNLISPDFLAPATLIVRGGGFGRVDGVEPKDRLDDYSWAALKRLSRAIAAAASDAEGLAIAREYSLVDKDHRLWGDTKAITLKDERKTVALVRILGFRHDKLAGGGKAGISFEFANTPAKHCMNPKPTNRGGWEASDMRKWLNNGRRGFLALLPDDLRSHVMPTKKRTNNRGWVTRENDISPVTAKPDRLWLLSMCEVYGRLSGQGKIAPWSAATYEAEGEQYQLYKDMGVTLLNDDPCWKDGADSWWWLRSPRADDANGFLDVSLVGDWYYDYPIASGACPPASASSHPESRIAHALCGVRGRWGCIMKKGGPACPACPSTSMPGRGVKRILRADRMVRRTKALRTCGRKADGQTWRWRELA